MNGINAPQRPDCVAGAAATFERYPYVSSWRPDWLADDAVSCELVSAANSLLTGKLTGNFANSGPQQRFPHLINELIQRLAAKFPTQRNREFLDAYQGKFFEEQGICILISGRTWIARQTNAVMATAPHFAHWGNTGPSVSNSLSYRDRFSHASECRPSRLPPPIWRYRFSCAPSSPPVCCRASPCPACLPSPGYRDSARPR